MATRNPVGRKATELRPITIRSQVNRYAEGSVLIEWGNTHVLCTASLDSWVPKWLEGKGRGWVTAEYSMLPRSTHTRMKRDREKLSGRTSEIQRLIARSLRSMVDLRALGERQIIVDCDVLQADGGTRTASITGGCVALGIALGGLIRDKVIPPEAWVDTVSAVSLGWREEQVLTDLDYDEDSQIDVDINYVLNGKNEFIEIQGTAEQRPFSRSVLDEFSNSAVSAAEQLKILQLNALKASQVEVPFC